jgi:hypothetical protein
MAESTDSGSSETYLGSCLCGAVKFVLLGQPSSVSHCHCSMCRKGHGAAFATYVSIEKSKVRFLAGLDNLTSYNSSSSVVRNFCKTCGSNIEWTGHPKYREWTSIPLALLDTPFEPLSIRQYFPESQVSWCRLS